MLSIRGFLAYLEFLAAEECPANASGFVMKISGRRVDDENLQMAEEGSLRRLFHSMLDLVEKGHSVHMYPDFNPSLSWHLDDEGIYALCCPSMNKRYPRQIKFVLSQERSIG